MRSIYKKYLKGNNVSAIISALLVVLLSLEFLTYTINYKPSSYVLLDNYNANVKLALIEYEKTNKLEVNSNLSRGEYDRYIDLKNAIQKYADFDQATALINYPNGLVRVAGYERLLKLDSLNPAYYIKQSLLDTTYFYRYSNGCGIRMILVGEHIAQRTIPNIDSFYSTPPQDLIDYSLLSEDDKLEIKEQYSKIQKKKRLYFEKYYSSLN